MVAFALAVIQKCTNSREGSSISIKSDITIRTLAKQHSVKFEIELIQCQFETFDRLIEACVVNEIL